MTVEEAKKRVDNLAADCKQLAASAANCKELFECIDALRAAATEYAQEAEREGAESVIINERDNDTASGGVFIAEASFTIYCNTPPTNC